MHPETCPRCYKPSGIRKKTKKRFVFFGKQYDVYECGWCPHVWRVWLSGAARSARRARR